MNSNLEDHLGTLIKCNTFLTDNAASFLGNADIASERVILANNIEGIFQADSTATRPLEGFTDWKAIKAKDLVDAVLLVRAGCVGYYRKNYDTGKLIIVDFPDSRMDQLRDKEISTVADQVHDVANQIKLLLAPYNVTAANVDAIPTKRTAYGLVLELPRTEEAISKAAGEDRDRLFDLAFKTTLENLKAYLLTFKYTNPNLFSRWQTALMIDNSGGGSGTEGYDVQTFLIPPNSSVAFGAVPPADKFFYTRQIGGALGVLACVKPLNTDSCTTGFEMVPGVTTKKILNEYPLVGSGFIIFTNPNSETVTVRAGVKIS